VPSALFALTLAAALGCGLAAGVFFAFSTFVMPALSRLPAPGGIAAMQSINVAAVNPWFMTALFGTVLICVASIAVALAEWDGAYGPYLLARGTIYVLGTIMVTIACNVPRNEALAQVDPAAAGAEGLWARYLREWRGRNHVRTAAPLIAAGLEIGALHAA
jgi:uncharacterized membrane protein